MTGGKKQAWKEGNDTAETRGYEVEDAGELTRELG